MVFIEKESSRKHGNIEKVTIFSSIQKEIDNFSQKTFHKTNNETNK